MAKLFSRSVPLKAYGILSVSSKTEYVAAAKLWARSRVSCNPGSNDLSFRRVLSRRYRKHEPRASGRRTGSIGEELAKGIRWEGCELARARLRALFLAFPIIVAIKGARPTSHVTPHAVPPGARTHCRLSGWRTAATHQWRTAADTWRLAHLPLARRRERSVATPKELLLVGRLEDSEGAHKRLVDAHDGACVVKLATVIRS